VNYIFIENPIRKVFFNMMEVEKSFTNYRLISEKTLTSIHDDSIIYKEYVFEGDKYIYNTWVFDKHAIEGFTISPIELLLDKTNYLQLFPYQTMTEYLQSDDFGEIYSTKADEIVYFIYDDDRVALKFQNGLLRSIAMYRSQS
jgi:hypothetical protein